MQEEGTSMEPVSRAARMPDVARVEPSQRWVRVEFNGQIVADSKRPLLVWPKEHPLPAYYFPWDDVDGEALAPNRRSGDGKQYYDLHVGDRRAEAAVWRYPDDTDFGLSDYVSFKWNKMDHWYEEEQEIFAHPRDPYHRVDAVPSSRHIEVLVDGVKVADTQRPVLVFETGLPVRYYIPQEDIRMALLEPTQAISYCAYKGAASYWSVATGKGTRRNIVWSYLEPVPEQPKIQGLLSFFNEKVDIYVDGELEERPQTVWS